MKKDVYTLPNGVVRPIFCTTLIAMLSACGGGSSPQQPAAEATASATELAAISYNSAAAANDLYVAASGSDSNAGTKTAPFKTILHASQVAQAGSTVHVAAGTYPGGFKTTLSGTASARVRYVSDTKWGAKIVPPAGSSTAIAWENRGDYVDIDGFEVDGSTAQGGTAWTIGLYTAGSFDTIASNHVHHIATTLACSGAGGGIGSDSYYGGASNDVLANSVHNIGPANCSAFVGVFMYTADSAVKNNLVYNMAGAGVRLWRDAAKVDVINNTIFATGLAVLVGGGDSYHATALDDYSQVSNNIIYDNVYGIVEQGTTGTHNSYSNNLYGKNSGYDLQLANGNTQSGQVLADPKFVNYVRTGGGDYHLQSSSPAIGKGAASNAPATDFDGVARTAASGFDIGAYQHTGTVATPPATTPPTSTTPPVVATTYSFYVATTGSDSNPGTAAKPFKTILAASKVARASTTIFVAPGTYDGGFETTVSGTASGRIHYLSSTKWGAKIVPPASSSNNTAWDNRGSYVDIDGFDIDGSVTQSGTAWLHGIYNGGSYDGIENNHVHNIAQKVACTSAGGSAIGVDSYYHGVMSSVVGNVVHDIGPAGCAYVQGIYISTSGSVVNNVVYRVAEAAIHLWHDATNVTIANNTVADSDTGIIVGGGDFYYTSGPDDNTHVVNNIVYDNRYGISEQGSTGVHNTYSNNLSFQNSSYNWSLRNSLPNTASVTADPQFTSYTRTGTPDFHLRSTSPAIGKGTASYTLGSDINGVARTTRIDLGAYQYN